MRKFNWLYLFLALAVPGSLSAQETGSLRGTVTDASDLRPIPSAQVTIVGTGQGTLTDTEGRFLFTSVPAGTHTVRVQLIGFGTATQTVQVTAGQAATVDFELEGTAIELDEIVVTGVSGGTVRAKVPFDIANVRAEEMPVPSVNPATALQGKVAGASVVSGSGNPGSAPSILLRGATSINASGRDQEPLYIVDGVILGGSLVDIASRDIESIEVIKGAAAASLYGSRAANGVIQIRTRRGQGFDDNTIRYTVRSQVGQSEMPNTPDILVGERHPFAMQGGQLVDENGDLCATYLECAAAPTYAGDDAWDTFQVNEWPGGTYDQIEQFFDQGGGGFMEHYVSAEGRAGRTNFHVSYNNLQDEGVIPGLEGLNRHSFRVNLDQAMRENVNVSASAFYSLSDSDVFPETQGNPMFALTRARAGVNPLACEDNLQETCLDDPMNIILQLDPFNSEADNPLNTLLNRQYTEDRGRFLGSGTVRYTPVGWFDIEGNASYDRLDREEQDYFPKGFRTTTTDASLNEGFLDRYRLTTEALNASVTGTARFNLSENINNRTQLRYLYEQQDRETTYTSGYNMAVANVPVFQNVDPETFGASSSFQSIRSDGYFAITNFDLYDRYIIDALVRNDGSSLFGEEERRQWYYRIAGAWRIAQEDWFNLPATDEIKLRYAHGTAGGRPNFSAQYETFSVSAGSISPLALGNDQLRPEHSSEHELGLDASFLNGRIGLGLTYANTVTEHQILQVPLASYAGYRTQYQNVGTLESNTYEASLEARLLQTENMLWSARVLFDRTRSEITELTAPPFQYGVAGQNLGSVFFAREGEEMGTFYGAMAATSCDQLPSGLSCDEFTTNDDGLLVWVGEDGSLDNPEWGTSSGYSVQGVPVMWGTTFQGMCEDPSGERTFTCPVGNSMPDYNMSFSSTFSWGGLSLYGLIDAVQGFDVYNQPLQWAIFAETAGIFDQDPGSDNMKPVGYYSGMYGNLGGLQPSSLFVEDGSFVKLREVALQYRFGADQLSGVPGLNIFSGIGLSLTGRNLHTWTDYRGFDPEVGKSGGDTGSAALARVEGYQYPNFRTVTFGIDVNF